jgi:aminoglycoside phosphotransferase (APT) family kinase protein
MDGDAPPELWTTPTTATLLGEAAADPVLVAGLRTARALWRSLALVHGDLKHDNVLVEPTPDGLRVRVLDWEMARIGDPAWDLAGLTARLAVVRGEAPPWPDEDLAGVALLVHAYATASGLRPPALARRLMLYSGAVLLMIALQHGSTLAPGADTSGARTLIMKARATFRRAERLTAAVIANLETHTA